MKRLTARLSLAGLLLAGIWASAPLRAQQAPEDTDGPGRGVARLSLINGDVSIKRGDSGDWVAAAINAPLLAEDRIATGPMARTEVQFDYYHRLRIAPDSDVRLAELEYRRYMVQLARGTVTFAALPGGDAQVEISTPGAAVRPVDHGSYRVTVLPDGTAEITVRKGEAEIFTPRGSQRLRPGRTMLVRPDGGGGPEFSLVSAIDRDEWDRFNEARDRELRRGEEIYSRYVPRDVYGAEDLAGHGRWIYAAPYGYVWQPFVAAGWAPYTLGRWAWLDWYGWTWVSYDPWGWAPYHYGRWFMHGGSWCWFPGAFGARHWWRPALVGWIGFGGPNWGVGLGFGHVGWVPLAPFEPLYPWWGPRFYRGFRGGNFIQNNVTIVNNTNVTNIYRNARFRNAVNVVNGEDFSRGSFGRARHASPEELRNANLVRGAVPVAPDRGSLRFSDREARVNFAANNNAGQERFFSRREAARVERVPFEEQRRAFTGGGEGPRSGLAALGGSGDRGAGPEARNPNAAGSGGWRRFGDPRATAPAETRSGDPAQGFGRSGGGERTNVLPSRRGETATDSGGWRRFGDPGQGARIETPRSEAPRAEGESRSGWSTGGGVRSSETPRTGSESRSGWSTFGSRERATDTPRSGNENRSGWSTGGGVRERSAAPETPRMETPRTAPSERNWSTGGGARERTTAPEGPRNESPRAAPRSAGPDQTSWSTGGRFGSMRSEATESRSPSWSTGGSRGESRSMEMPRSTGGFSRPEGFGGGGGYSAPSRSAPAFGGGSMRSAPSGGFGGGGFGGGSVRSAPSGGFGGGGGGSIRSAPSGGGMRSGGGFSGSGIRSGGGGSSRSGLGSRGGGRQE